MFRCIVTTINSSNKVSPRLMGEALHVYASTWLLLNGSSSSQRRILDTVVSLIPADKGSVSVKFLLRLLSLSTSVGVSPVTKAQLLRFSALQLEEATLDDLLFPVQSGNDCRTSYDVDLVRTVLHSFMRRWKRQTGERQSLVKVGKIVDSYLQVVAKDANMTIKKMISLIESLPGIARPQHDNLYKAINIYLKEHPEVSKEDKKELCKYLDCQKMSAEVRSHAVKNERLPLRTVVQALFFEQEKSCSGSAEQLGTPVVREQLSSKLKLNAEERSSEAKGTTPFARGTSKIRQHSRRFDDKQQLRPEPSFTIRPQMENGSEIKQDGAQLSTHGTAQARRVSEKTHGKGRER